MPSVTERRIFMLCPARGCGIRVEVSPEDPDASQSELWRHIAHAHPLNDAGALLAVARVVDSSGRVVFDDELMAWLP